MTFSESLRKTAQKTVTALRTAGELVCDLYEGALVEVVGKDWREQCERLTHKQVAEKLTVLEVALKKLLISEGADPRAASDYVRYGRRAVKYEAGFKWGRVLTLKDLPRFDELIKQQQGTPAEKYEAAFKLLRAEKRAKVDLGPRGFVFPAPEEGEDIINWVGDLKQALNDYLSQYEIEVTVTGRKPKKMEVTAPAPAPAAPDLNGINYGCGRYLVGV